MLRYDKNNMYERYDENQAMIKNKAFSCHKNIYDSCSWKKLQQFGHIKLTLRFSSWFAKKYGAGGWNFFFFQISI